MSRMHAERSLSLYILDSVLDDLLSVYLLRKDCQETGLPLSYLTLSLPPCLHALIEVCI